jgi:hypothetical protein
MGHGGSARWEKEDAQAGTKMNLFYTRYKTTTYNTYGIRCDTEEDGTQRKRKMGNGGRAGWDKENLFYTRYKTSTIT